MGLVITARHRNTALLVAGCFFMEMLDGTIVTTATPQIGKSLHAPPTSVGLVVTAYLLTLGVLIPLSGWLTRRFGNRAIFLTAIALFTLASIGCASSVSLGMLVGMRVLQGAGGAMMVPVGRNMVVSMADKRDLLKVTVADCTIGREPVLDLAPGASDLHRPRYAEPEGSPGLRRHLPG